MKTDILLNELRGSFDFFLEFTNRKIGSPGFGLTVDSTKKPAVASIASVGFALTAWAIAAERGYLDRETACQITRGTLSTLLTNASQQHGFFSHFLHLETADRIGKSEYSTIDTAICLNGVITAAAYFHQDAGIADLAARLLERVDWDFLVFTREDKTLFSMAYNPDHEGDYVRGEPGLVGQWDMAAEQKMMYLQAAPRLEAQTARRLYQGFRRDTGAYAGAPVILNPGGNLFAYQFSEAWLDTARLLDPDGVDWFENTRRAALANRAFCIANADRYKAYHENSWGLSAGDSPKGYRVFGSPPCLKTPRHDGTVSIYSAVACLPFLPDMTLDLIHFLHDQRPRTWGPYGFYDAYNLDVAPAWYSHTLYGIDKGCSMLMIENHLTGLVWELYTGSPYIRQALEILQFRPRPDAGAQRP
ncbi:MAG: hypothetical protein FJZ96_02160 [Chloroflexi bacterium]|nr:hypothetical protein [Chloroflexota bacterium]